MAPAASASPRRTLYMPLFSWYLTLKNSTLQFDPGVIYYMPILMGGSDDGMHVPPALAAP